MVSLVCFHILFFLFSGSIYVMFCVCAGNIHLNKTKNPKKYQQKKNYNKSQSVSSAQSDRPYKIIHLSSFLFCFIFSVWFFVLFLLLKWVGNYMCHDHDHYFHYYPIKSIIFVINFLFIYFLLKFL